jgi:type IV pilus assembly protein PilN
MIKINLLSEGRRPVVARKAKASFNLGGQDPNNLLLIAGILLGVLAAGGWWYVVNSELSALERKVRDAKAEYEKLRPIIQEVSEYKQTKEDLEKKVQVINNLKSNQKGPVHIMDQVSKAVPELLWLEQMSVRGKQVSLKGQAFNPNAIATFIQRLDEVQEFAEPSARNIKKAGRGGTISYSFQIDFGFTLPVDEPEEEAEAVEGP